MQTASSPSRTTHPWRRTLLLVSSMALTAATAACNADQGVGAAATHVVQRGTPSSSSETPSGSPSAAPTSAAPATAKPAVRPKPVVKPKPAVKPKPVVKPEPAPVIVLRPGDSGPKVRSL